MIKPLLNDILKLGDPRLYEISQPVKKEEIQSLLPVIEKLWLLILEFRKTYGAGRAIAAPQIGVQKRIICMYIDEPLVFINPVLEELSKEMIELWDDCMCFPSLMVRVKRHKSCKMRYLNMNWEESAMELRDDLAELIQHEYDHLEGILATQRAIDNHSFKWRS
jgi:peptide deformylase